MSDEEDQMKADADQDSQVKKKGKEGVGGGGGGAVCSIMGCNNKFRNTRRSERKVTFHSFPRDPLLRKKWIKVCSDRATLKPKNSRVCSDHFLPEDYELNFREQLLGIKTSSKLKKGVVPTQNLHPKFGKNESPAVLRRRIKNEEKRKESERKAIIAELLAESDKPQETIIKPKSKRSKYPEPPPPSSDHSYPSKPVTRRVQRNYKEDYSDDEEEVDDPDVDKDFEPTGKTITIQTNFGVKYVPASSLKVSPKSKASPKISSKASKDAAPSTPESEAYSNNFHRLYLEAKRQLEDVEKIAEDLRLENQQLHNHIMTLKDNYKREKFNFHQKLVEKMSEIKTKNQIIVADTHNRNLGGVKSVNERRNRIMKSCFSLVKDNDAPNSDDEHADMDL